MRKNSKLNTTQIVTPMPTERPFIDPKHWQLPSNSVAVVDLYTTIMVVPLPNPKHFQ